MIKLFRMREIALFGRLTACLGVLVLGFSFGGCKLATIRPPGGGDGGAPQQNPREFFDTMVQPILVMECAGCHEGAGSQGPEFLTIGSYYASVTTWTNASSEPLFVAGEPGMSNLVTYVEGGSHRGGPYDPGSRAIVEQWINLEGGGMIGPGEDAGPPMMQEPVQTDPRRVNPGVTNSIPLSTGDVGLTGAFFVFDAELNGTNLIMRDIRIQAGPRGISVTQPLLYIWESDDTTGTPDAQTDRFMQSNFQIDAATEEPLATQETLVDFPVDGMLSIEFATVEFMN